mgnify:FL=1|tara:strand:+ start:1041 stop:1220 length:180 start_codon:yes stop_codon:yes gene_type:complete
MKDNKKMNKEILVEITNQSNRTRTDLLTANELIHLSGSHNVKSLDVIEWNFKSEYRRVA